MDGIFISYRREDTSGEAGRLSDRLAAHFGADRVFMDVDGIEPGADFVTAIEDAVGSCRVLIALIGDEWLDMRNAEGQRRLDDPQDFVRIEVATALKRDIRVLPLLVDRAVMPRADDLPADLKPLARRHALVLQHTQWDASTATLIKALERLLGERAAGGLKPGMAWQRWSAALAGVAVMGGAGAWWGGWLSVAQNDDDADWRRVAAAPEAAPSPPMATATAPPSAAPPSAAGLPPPTVVAAAPPSAPPVAAAGAGRVPTASMPARTTAATRITPAPPGPVAAAPAAAPRPVPPAAAAAGAAAPALASGGLPVSGQRWTYRVQGKWPGSPRRSVEFSVNQVQGETVVERLSDPASSDATERRSRAGQGGFVTWPGIGIEFSPYLGAAGLDNWRDGSIATPDIDPQWTQWHSEGKVVGRESVGVPAGRFDAVKVEVWSNRMATGGAASITLEPVRVQYLVWYAPQVKRYVRMQRRVLSAGGQEIERDTFELESQRGG